GRVVHLVSDIREPLVGLTVGWAILGLRKPWPSRRRLFRTAGSAMGFSSLIGLAIGLIEYVDLVIFRYMPNEHYWGFFIRNELLVSTMAAPAGSMALGALVGLVVTGARRPGRSPLDRIGLILGLLWVFPSVSGWLYPWLHSVAPS
ncbi:hypothetical protein, partial [Paraburkholderia sp. JHI869]|uniref:hypothetical protein n=1 Tax=Paraburkholderia sp. JHI869 TaxID=3112959 RepID=UPI003176EB45